ncbi:hypothetical protein [Burkholderia glumae]|uniref:hypothetical protein n=1 Tax=Burkholderia glumae TaxID=337 RepID=UPI002037494E|nr:hypothetical protein [Burkholderia glumae]MCM2552655.1 hypothetical protein [Burkholderia glumae]
MTDPKATIAKKASHTLNSRHSMPAAFGTSDKKWRTGERRDDSTLMIVSNRT